MINITLQDNLLQVSGDSEFLKDDDHILFFQLSLGFTERGVPGGSSCRWVFDGNVTSELISTIIDYLRDFDTEFTMNPQVEKMWMSEKRKGEKFEDLKKRGKNIKQEKEVLIKSIKKGISLMAYQKIPVRHAIEMGNSANFSVPGAGKTWMAYFTYMTLKKSGLVNKLLVISPLSAFRPWEVEYKNIFGTKPRVHRIKSKFITHVKHELENNEIFLVSYTTAARYNAFIIELLEQKKFMVICDESHYIKNPNSERSEGLHELSPFAEKRMILTGTPMPKDVQDLWSQFTFLYPEKNILGDYEYFKHQIKTKGKEEIKRILEPYYTRVSLNELKLPKALFQRKKISMSPLQRDIYDAIAGTIFSKYKKRIKEYDELDEWRTNMMIYLLEAAVDPSLLTKEKGFKKIDPAEILDFKKMSFADMIRNYRKAKETPAKIEKTVKEVIKIVDKNEKVVVWSSFVRTIQRIQDELKEKGYDSFTITGKVPQDEEADANDNREKRIEDFKNSSTNVLVANPASCAESISLHKHCQKALYLDRNFNGAQYMQSLARIHRVGMGKTNPKYLMLLSENSIDEDIDERLTFKHQEMLNFLNDDFPVVNLDLDDKKTIFGLENEKNDDFELVLKRINKNRRRKK